jgi:hypothetical protein
MRPRITVLTAMILTAAATRLLPHPPNVTPIAALALFGGAQFTEKRFAFIVPLFALLLSDFVLGFHSGMAAVYGSFAAIVLLGSALRTRRTVFPIAVAALAGSLIFFAVTNFAVWTAGALYPRTGTGLLECYVAAIPFFRNTVGGDAFFTAVLFGGFALAQKRWPVLTETFVAAA